MNRIEGFSQFELDKAIGAASEIGERPSNNDVAAVIPTEWGFRVIMLDGATGSSTLVRHLAKLMSGSPNASAEELLNSDFSEESFESASGFAGGLADVNLNRGEVVISWMRGGDVQFVLVLEKEVEHLSDHDYFYVKNGRRRRFSLGGTYTTDTGVEIAFEDFQHAMESLPEFTDEMSALSRMQRQEYLENHRLELLIKLGFEEEVAKSFFQQSSNILLTGISTSTILPSKLKGALALIVFTDGVANGVSDEMIRQLLERTDSAHGLSRALLEQASRWSGDNLSAAAVLFDDDFREHMAELEAIATELESGQRFSFLLGDSGVEVSFDLSDGRCQVGILGGDFEARLNYEFSGEFMLQRVTLFDWSGIDRQNNTAEGDAIEQADEDPEEIVELIVKFSERSLFDQVQDKLGELGVASPRLVWATIGELLGKRSAGELIDSFEEGDLLY